MAIISTYAADKLLDHLLGTTAYTMPTVYLGLFTTAPTMPAGTGGVEVSTTSTAYAREELTGKLDAATAESVTTTSNIAFPAATANWGTIVGAGLFDASAGGNLLAYTPLDTPQTITTAGTLTFTAGNLTFTLS